MVAMNVRLAACAVLAWPGLGCSTLDRYSTAAGESLCGSVTSTASFRTGLAAGARMRLTLDASQLDGEASPGTVWTYEPAEGENPARKLANGAPLRRIPALENDPLSSPDLGGGRDHTRFFALTPAEPIEQPLLGVLSLRSDDGVEVRLLRPGVASAAAEGQAPIFGLFTLAKQAGTCGF
jgi:hypothetical protein